VPARGAGRESAATPPGRPSWDEDSPELRANLTAVLRGIRDASGARAGLGSETARAWHEATMAGLSVPDARYVGRFRGEPGVEHREVVIGAHSGVPAAEVRAALAAFDERLAAALARLDALVRPGSLPEADPLAAVIDVMAWAHAEWIRIHPFANGNGRTARIWANAIALRYGLPPFVRLRPRPGLGYGAAGAHAMTGDWLPTTVVFRRMLARFVLEHGEGGAGRSRRGSK
jgi:hypothetical protein